jgi:predicted RNase H-like nuclease (RuvC/YqgF family)
MSVNQITVAKELTLAPIERRTSSASVAQTTITQAVAKAQAEAKAEAEQETTVVDTNPLTEQQELQNLRQIIVTWREIEGEVSTLSAQIREKNKRKKALEEMILRIMKKYNIGALDLKGSGGRLLYRKQTTKATLNPKTLTGLLAGHLKSETAAAEAIKYIVENREARPRESLLYEKN